MVKSISNLIENLSDEDIRQKLHHVSLRDLTVALAAGPHKTKLRMIKVFDHILGAHIMKVFQFNIQSFEKRPLSDLEIHRCTQSVINALSGKEFLDWNTSLEKK